MAKKPRDTVLYALKKGNKVEYIGTTNDPDRREAEHAADGKNFGHMKVLTRRMTEEGAQQQEADALETYRRSHGGKNPRLNKDDDG